MTWEQVLHKIDTLLDTYATLIDTDPEHGLLYQQRMAYWAYQRQNVVAKIHQEHIGNKA